MTVLSASLAFLWYCDAGNALSVSHTGWWKRQNASGSALKPVFLGANSDVQLIHCTGISRLFNPSVYVGEEKYVIA